MIFPSPSLSIVAIKSAALLFLKWQPRFSGNIANDKIQQYMKNERKEEAHISGDFSKKCCSSRSEISPLPSTSYSENVFCKYLASACEMEHFFFPFPLTAAAPLLGGIAAVPTINSAFHHSETESALVSKLFVRQQLTASKKTKSRSRYNVCH